MGDPDSLPPLQTALSRYAEAITPWATAAVNAMHTQVDVRDLSAWQELSLELKRGLMSEIRRAPTGTEMRRLMGEQVVLIRSLPLDAAQRVHDWTMAGLVDGTRAPEVAAAIRDTYGVTQARATLIARTETSRTAATLQEARAKYVGADSYVWRTSGDSDVRPSHRKLNGTPHRWDNPPICDPPNHRAHPGCIWNCFPGSTKVALTNGCHELYRRWYEGRLVVVEHEVGLLELTPNHPVLTRRGWVAAENLHAGDDLVQAQQDRLFALDDDEHEGQPSFSEVFAALESVLDRKAHDGLLFDFHGDRPDDDVDAIRADHLLPGYGISPQFERVCNLAFSGSDSRIANPGVVCGSAHVGEAHVPSGGRDLDAIFPRHRLHSTDVGLARAPALDTVTLQYASDRETRAAKSQRETEFAFARDIAGHDLALVKVRASVRCRATAAQDHDAASPEILADKVRAVADLSGRIAQTGSRQYKSLRVVDTFSRAFSGHVYTMATSDGWFSVTSAAVIVKNCRCFADPIVPDIA